MEPKSFDRFAAYCAILAGISGLLYSVAFIVLQSGWLSALFLMLGGLFSSAALIGLYQRLRATETGFVLLALLLSLSAALGSTIHGGYDLANAFHPPANANLDLPNQVDPRGLLTFGVAGIGLFLLAWLIARNGSFPKGLSTLGYISAALLVVIYVARLVVLQPTNPILLIPALVEGFIANPIWYIWLGVALGLGGMPRAKITSVG